ncbi:MAG: hypothetical protein AAF449_07580 [Myxococcota bacterium]
MGVIGCADERQHYKGVTQVLKCGDRVIMVRDQDLGIASPGRLPRWCPIGISEPVIACTEQMAFAAGHATSDSMYFVRKWPLGDQARCQIAQVAVRNYKNIRDATLVALTDNRALLFAPEQAAHLVIPSDHENGGLDVPLNTFPKRGDRPTFPFVASSLERNVVWARVDSGRVAVAERGSSVLYSVPNNKTTLDELSDAQEHDIDKSIEYFGALEFPSPIRDIIAVNETTLVLTEKSLCEVQSNELPLPALYGTSANYESFTRACMPLEARRFLGFAPPDQAALLSTKGLLILLRLSNLERREVAPLSDVAAICSTPKEALIALEKNGAYALGLDGQWSLRRAGRFSDCASLADKAVLVGVSGVVSLPVEPKSNLLIWTTAGLVLMLTMYAGWRWTKGKALKTLAASTASPEKHIAGAGRADARSPRERTTPNSGRADQQAPSTIIINHAALAEFIVSSFTVDELHIFVTNSSLPTASIAWSKPLATVAHDVIIAFEHRGLLGEFRALLLRARPARRDTIEAALKS